MQTRQLTPEILVTRLGDYLVERGYISADDLKNALDYQASMRTANEPPQLLGQILIQMGAIDRATLDTAVTEQILQLRNALTSANQRLEQRVLERTAELEQALAKLSELNQLKSNFVANISHELRTPLTHLKGYLELLATTDLGPLNTGQNQAVKIMQRSSDRLENLIEDMILFSMMERGTVNLRMVPFSVMNMCKKVEARSRNKATDHHINLSLDCEPDLPNALGDEEKISWVMQQLLDNAIKFSSQAGNVLVKAEKDGKFIRLSVTDTGIGIPADKINEIFEPFHQLDGSSTRKVGGTGLGLSLAKKIIEAHNSVIHVTSKVGQGSQFAFLLTTIEIKQTATK
jgi:two-component system, sensor histidine kinase and response regulator